MATSTTQWASYLDLAEVETWLQFTGAALPADTQAILQRVIDAACTRAQNIAARPFAPTTFKERHDGWSGEYVMLRYSPVLELTLCREWQSSGGFIVLPESTPENPVDGVQVDYATGRIMRTFAGYSWPRPFFPGSRNIEITYQAGFNPVPPDVWEATVDLVAYWWRNTQQAARGSTGWRPANGEYGGGEEGPNDLWPGVPNRIAEVFESYRDPVIG